MNKEAGEGDDADKKGDDADKKGAQSSQPQPSLTPDTKLEEVEEVEEKVEEEETVEGVLPAL